MTSKSEACPNGFSIVNIQYGSNKNYQGAVEKLFLDVYQPSGDTASARPLILFIHGGGFSAGTKTDGKTRILMGGTSAGGALSLNYAYMDANEIPRYIDTAHERSHGHV